jgi:hypothetical protein
MAVLLGTTASGATSGDKTLSTAATPHTFVHGTTASQGYKDGCKVNIEGVEYTSVTWTGDVLTLAAQGLKADVGSGKNVHKVYEGHNGDQPEHSRKYNLGII